MPPTLPSALWTGALAESNARSWSCFGCARKVAVRAGAGAGPQQLLHYRLSRRNISFGPTLARPTAAAAAVPPPPPPDKGKAQELDHGRYFWTNEIRRRLNESKENVGKYGHEGKKMQEVEAQMAQESSANTATAFQAGILTTPRAEQAIDQTTQRAVEQAASVLPFPVPASASASTPAPSASTSTPAPQPTTRARARRKAPSSLSSSASPSSSPSSSSSSSSQDALPDLPHDASAQLSQMAAASPLSFKKRFFTYLALTKPRLAFLVVLTSAAGYAMYPVPSLLSAAATHTPTLSSLTLLFLTTGTFACIAAANTLNMLFEPAYDAQMTRTRNRPLVRKLVSPRSAYLFAFLTAVSGAGILWLGVNPTTAVLGTGNLVLYAFVYTPLKRISCVNTWVGAVVGAIPPLMGWCAAAGQYASSTPTAYRPFSPSSSSSSSTPEHDSTPQPHQQITSTSTLTALADEMSLLLLTPQATGGWLLAALLFAWQFPHFNALAHPIRHEYRNAGYRMLAWFHPARNTRVALRYSLLMFPICIGLTAAGVTDKYFVITSSVLNGWMAREAWRFWRSGGGESKEAAKSARGLFWASVWHLPIILVLAMAQKEGLWDGVWRTVFGTASGIGEDDGEWEYEDDDDDE